MGLCEHGNEKGDVAGQHGQCGQCREEALAPLLKASSVCPVCGIAVPHAHDYAGLMTLIVKQKNDLAAAQSYATTLAVSMHKQHYAEAAPNWQPLSDLVGLLTQIDNMYAGLRNDLEAAEVENKRLVGLPLASLLEERYALQIAWETAKKQNSHDMLLSGDEIHMHDAAINQARGTK